ncbi:MAG: PaaI family thioesterase [Lacunisphaera sp.]|nr:PaaI family thioesterase [Lacunisphaera sp.]
MNTAAAAPTEAILRATGRREHPGCFACGDPAAGGLGLKFKIAVPGGVEARWTCPAGGESYPGIMHGGMVATLLDAAMVHALFARGITARTGELRIRYRRPVSSGSPVTIRGWLVRACGPLFMLQAELQQDDSLCAEARAKFMQIPGAGEPVGRAGVVIPLRTP